MTAPAIRACVLGWALSVGGSLALSGTPFEQGELPPADVLQQWRAGLKSEDAAEPWGQIVN